MKKAALVFLGNPTYDARCVNMVSSLIQHDYKVTIYNAHLSQARGPNIIYKKIYSTSIPYLKYACWFLLVYIIVNTKKQYDVIIASDLYSLFPLGLTKQSNLVYDCREIYTQLSVHRGNKFKNYLLYVLEKMCFKKIKKIIVTAKSDQKYLEKLYPSNLAHYKIIYNFPQSKLIQKKSSYFQHRYKIQNNQMILLYQGVIQKNRGILQLIKIVKNTKNTVGVIVGSGRYLGYLKNFVAKHDLTNRIMFHPPMPYAELLKATSSAHVGVALIMPVGTSNQLALPNKLFEYALAEIPVLGSNIFNMRKYIEKYNLGWATNPLCLSTQTSIIKLYQKKIKTSSFGINSELMKNLTWEYQEKSFIKFIAHV